MVSAICTRMRAATSSVHPRIEAAQAESNLKYFSANAYELNIDSTKEVIKLYQQNCNFDNLRDLKQTDNYNCTNNNKNIECSHSI
jgi:hypothetical protein